MPTMPGEMSKGEILQDLDRLINDRPVRKEMLADLEARDPITDRPQYTIPEIAVRVGLVRAGSKEEKHLANDWFGTSWWNKSMTPEEKDHTVRAGLCVAINEADLRDLPIDCYWVCALHGKPEEKMQVTISWSEHQVTLILLTADPPIEDMEAVGDPIKIVAWERGPLELHNLRTNTYEQLQ
jgi:hypothetical protein